MGIDMWFLALKFSHYPSRYPNFLPLPVPIPSRSQKPLPVSLCPPLAPHSFENFDIFYNLTFLTILNNFDNDNPCDLWDIDYGTWIHDNLCNSCDVYFKETKKSEEKIDFIYQLSHLSSFVRMFIPLSNSQKYLHHLTVF